MYFHPAFAQCWSFFLVWYQSLSVKVFLNDLIKKVNSEETKSADNTTIQETRQWSVVEGSCDTKQLGYKTANEIKCKKMQSNA